MGKWVRRIAIATAVSVGIHLGIAGGLQYSLPEKTKQAPAQVEQKPKINSPPLAEKPLGAKAEEKKAAEQEKAKIKKPDLHALMHEREEFVKETLSKLNGGKKIRLSDFFIRAEALDKNIEMAEKGEFGPKESDLRAKYFELVKKAEADILGAENEIEALHRSMHTSMNGYFWASGSIIDVLERGWYNCSSSTELFSALLQDVLGRENFKILVFNDHLANVAGKDRIDAVNHEWKTASVKFNGCGFPVPPQVMIASYLRKNGIALEDMPGGVAEYFSVDRKWPGICPTKAKNMDEMGAGSNSYSLPVPDINSGLTIPSVFVPNPKFQASTEKVVSMARGLLAAYRFAEANGNRKIVEKEPSSRQKKMPKISKMDGTIELIITHPLKIPENIEWGEILEMFKDYFDANMMVGLWKERAACIYPLARIPPETIPDMLKEMPEADAKKWEYYSRENICKRAKRAAESGTVPEIWNYQSFDFCPKDSPEVNEALKKRYLQERNGDILRFSLASAALAENFDFFLSEFRNPISLDIKRKAAAGMLFADNGKACGIFKGLSEGERLELSQQIVLGCHDEELAWRMTELRNSYNIEEIVALGMLEGNKLTKKQCEFMATKGAAAPQPGKTEIARILVECGNIEAAVRIAKSAVADFQSGADLNLKWEGTFPKELNAQFLPLLSQPLAALEVSKLMVCNGGVGEYRENIINSLRSLVNDKEKNTRERVEAAYVLLLMEVEPVPEQ